MTFGILCNYHNVWGVEDFSTPIGLPGSNRCYIGSSFRQANLIMQFTYDRRDADGVHLSNMWKREWNLEEILIDNAISSGIIPARIPRERIRVHSENWGVLLSTFLNDPDPAHSQVFPSEEAARASVRDYTYIGNVGIFGGVLRPQFIIGWSEVIDGFVVGSSHRITTASGFRISSVSELKTWFESFGVDLDNSPYTDTGDLPVPSAFDAVPSVDCALTNLGDSSNHTVTTFTTGSIANDIPTTITVIDGDPMVSEVERLDARINATVSGLSTHFQNNVAEINRRLTVISNINTGLEGRVRALEEE